jgi:CspA family cold shock protein
MGRGTIKWFSTARGYGYITPDNGGKEVFVHHSALRVPLAEGFRALETGARVEFTTRQGLRGPEAATVKAEVVASP